MARVKLDFKRLSVSDKIVRAQQIVKNLTGNPEFPTSQPAACAGHGAIQMLETKVVSAQSARQAAQAATAEQNDAEDALDRIIDQVGGYIASVSGGQERKVISGVSVRSSTSAPRELTAPGALAATEGDHDGEIQLHWDRVGAARSY